MQVTGDNVRNRGHQKQMVNEVRLHEISEGGSLKPFLNNGLSMKSIQQKIY